MREEGTILSISVRVLWGMVYLIKFVLIIPFSHLNWEFLDIIYKMSRIMRKPAFCICENKDADQLCGNAPVICIPGSLGAGDSGDIAGPKCRDLTFDESRQCRRCAGVLISRQNANLCHILTTRGKLSLYICTVWSALVSLSRWACQLES